jgi:molybdopterin biosynthesis enzyme MoaB
VTSPGPIRAAIVTVSDGVAAGERADQGGPACEEALRESGVAHVIVERLVLPDDRERVSAAAASIADAGRRTGSS